MLVVIFEGAYVFVAVREHHYALSVLEAIHEVTLVRSAIFELEGTLAVELTLCKMALVGLLLLCDVVNSLA